MVFEKKIFIVAITLSVILSIPFVSAYGELYSIWGTESGNILYTLNPLTGQETNILGMTLSGNPNLIYFGTGLAFDSTNDILYGVIIPDENFSERRVLVTIDPSTGFVNPVLGSCTANSPGDSVSTCENYITDGTANFLEIEDLAITQSGVLYGVTGETLLDGSSVNNLETLYILDKTTGIGSPVCSMSSSLSPDGEAIAFNANDELFRISGTGTTVLEKIDLTLPVPPTCPSSLVADLSSELVDPSGAPLFPAGDFEHIDSLAYDPSQNSFIASGGSGIVSGNLPWFLISEIGTVTIVEPPGSPTDLNHFSADLAGLEPISTGDSPPTAIDDWRTVDENSGPHLFDILSNDIEDNALNFATVIITLPTDGGSAIADPVTGIVSYTPAAGFTGTETFTYTVEDDAGQLSNSATVTVVVVPSGVEVGDGTTVGDGSTVGDGTTIGEGTEIQDDVTVAKDSEIGDDVVIETGTTVEKDTIIGDDVTIGTDSTVEKDTVIGDSTTIGSNTVISKDTIIDSGVTIGSDTTIEKNVLIGDTDETTLANTSIGSNVLIQKDTTIGNGVTVEDNVTIGTGVVIEDGATVLAGATVPNNTTILAGTTFPP